MKSRAKGAEKETLIKSPAIKKPKAAKKAATAGRDAAMPKKPPTAFFYYLEDFRKTFQEENPDVKSMRHVGKAGGEKWRTLPFEEKVQYYDIATKKRAEFDKAMAAYTKKKENGALSEGSEDCE